MQPKIVHLHEYGKSPEPLKIKIERNTKGFNWKVSDTGSSIEEILARDTRGQPCFKGRIWG